MGKIIWKTLKYKGNDFGSIFTISTLGEIKNQSTENILTGRWEGKTYYTMICFDNKTYRIKVGDAQVESGLPRLVFDMVEKKVQPKYKKNKFELSPDQRLEVKKIMEELLRSHNLIE